jgi:hypothetical protein
MRLVSGFLLLFLIGCKSSEKKADVNVNMPGAYKMLSQSAKGEKTDTTYGSPNQMKIYTEDFMIYASVNPKDSASSFGIGSYSINKDTVTENVIFTASDSTSNDTARNFTLIIEKTAKGYKQVITGIQFATEKVKLTEDYESTGTGAKTSLDGAWKMTSRHQIKGKDTTKGNAEQYKTYYAGNVIWGHVWKDSLNKKHTGVGFGKFEMNGNKVKETMTSSTYSSVTGQSFDIDIVLSGSDSFTQTMIDPDGTKSIEVYTKLKK